MGHSVRKPPVLVHRASPSPENEECEDGPQQNRPQEEEEEEEEGDDVLFSYLVITPPAKRMYTDTECAAGDAVDLRNCICLHSGTGSATQSPFL